MRLGGPVFEQYETPDEWVAAVRALGYRAAYCPVKPGADADIVRAYRAAAQASDIVIAEVGAWSNPLSPDASERQAALEKCKSSLALADAIGARCCVNVAGSRGAKWDGPSPLDLTDEAFDIIVETVRDIIDSVQPQRTFYTLEVMPYMIPDSAESYLDLLRAIDRKAFAVHFDPVNMVNSPRRYFNNGALLRDFVDKLGPHIQSCHAKDILLQERLTVHLDEVRPGCGYLDYPAFLRALAPLDPDLPLMLEHLPGPDEYNAAAAHVRNVAAQVDITL